MSPDNIQVKTAPENRRVDRVDSELKTIVQVKDGSGETWKEVTKVTTVSRNGAGFSLPRPVSVGRLVTLVMPLDPELRAYDEDKEVYPVLGLVQYCNQGKVNGETVFHVGVGFVGKNVPESFKADPTQSYRISGMRKDGLWEITEAESQFKNRKTPRYWISLPVTISLLQKAEQSGAREETFTKNISGGGVSVACSLVAAVGDKVKFACKEIDFYAVALVRNRKVGKNESPTLHLQFIDVELPVEKVIATRTVRSDG
jgi:PilZ domain